MGPLPVVYDTNVLVSGIAFGGNPWRCLVAVFVGDVELVTSEAALAEFERVLGYDHLPFTPVERERYPVLLQEEATVIRPDESVEAVDATRTTTYSSSVQWLATWPISSPATPISPTWVASEASPSSSRLPSSLDSRRDTTTRDRNRPTVADYEIFSTGYDHCRRFHNRPKSPGGEYHSDDIRN